jgi:hypothetical protein
MTPRNQLLASNINIPLHVEPNLPDTSVLYHSMKCLIYSLLGNPDITFVESQISSLGKFEFTF